MRWLIVGSYPPERGRGAQAAAAFVAERIDAGDEVHVVSPRPSAAHEHRDLVGRDALQWLRRAAQGHDGLWLRIEPGIGFTREPSRWTALLERFLLGRMLRSVPRSVLDVGDPSMLPGGRAGALVFGPVDRVVVHSAGDRDALVAAGAAAVELETDSSPGPPANDVDRGSVVAPAPAVAVDPMVPLAADATRAEIEAAVRARAREGSIS